MKIAENSFKSNSIYNNRFYLRSKSTEYYLLEDYNRFFDIEKDNLIHASYKSATNSVTFYLFFMND